MNQIKTKGNVTIYGVGGAGINLAYMFEDIRAKDIEGIASVTPVYADTSVSNLRPNISPDHFFHFKENNLEAAMDGAGGVRDAGTAQAVQTQMKKFLEKHRPGYASIVIHSSSGGSGSVIGPMLVNELLSTGNNLVVVVSIGDATTGKRITNTLNTSASYEAITQDLGKCVVMAGFENTEITPRTDVDAEVFDLVASLCGLFSRQNAEMDTMDLIKFLNISESTSYPPHLVKLEVIKGDLTPETAGEGIATVASLLPNRDSDAVGLMVDHRCAGFPVSATMQDTYKDTPHHFVTRTFGFNDQARRLRDLLEEQARVRAARVASSNLLTTAGSRSVGGLIL